MTSRCCSRCSLGRTRGRPRRWAIPALSSPLRRGTLATSLAGLRVAFAPDLGGTLVVDAEVGAVVRGAAERLAAAGAELVEAAPDLALADDTFRTLRAWHFHAKFADLLAQRPDDFKQSLADNIRAGASLTGVDVARAYTQRTALSEEMRQFFGGVDVLLLPTSQVPPFPVEQEFPTAINGQEMPDYLAWMRSAWAITVTGCPAISVPAGHTPAGLPVGVQLVAPHGADRRLLEIAAAFTAL
ncbi:amidase family protein [Nocardioides alcanivorans]|uniref:amidase family protein n=1 Tax=Nocardioides alcanivorans TaxID=2897352 RepID=UPI001EED43B6|nr:amidase family protein [Nocardioides alcanivorans]